MSNHTFKTQDGSCLTEWTLEFKPNHISVSLEQVRSGTCIAITTELTPAQAEDLREMLQLYQNSKRRSGK